MVSGEIEQVLSNWIAEANSSLGTLASGTDPAKWIAQHFLRWWSSRVSDEFGDASAGVSGALQEMERLGGWSNSELGGAMHELIHAREALQGLRVMLGLPPQDA